MDSSTGKTITIKDEDFPKSHKLTEGLFSLRLATLRLILSSPHGFVVTQIQHKDTETQRELCLDITAEMTIKVRIITGSPEKSFSSRCL